MNSDDRRVASALSFDDLHDEVNVAQDLFEYGFYREAVQKATERFNIRVSELAERPDLSGTGLMTAVFSETAPSLAFGEDRSKPSDRDLHNGYRFLAQGLALGVRNIYTHIIDLSVDEVEALEWLAFISAMHRRLDRTSKQRRQ